MQRHCLLARRLLSCNIQLPLRPLLPTLLVTHLLLPALMLLPPHLALRVRRSLAPPSPAGSVTASRLRQGRPRTRSVVYTRAPLSPLSPLCTPLRPRQHPCRRHWPSRCYSRHRRLRLGARTPQRHNPLPTVLPVTRQHDLAAMLELARIGSKHHLALGWGNITELARGNKVLHQALWHKRVAQVHTIAHTPAACSDPHPRPIGLLNNSLRFTRLPLLPKCHMLRRGKHVVRRSRIRHRRAVHTHTPTRGHCLPRAQFRNARFCARIRAGHIITRGVASAGFINLQVHTPATPPTPSVLSVAARRRPSFTARLGPLGTRIAPPGVAVWSPAAAASARP
jgi:hypothetical protein